MSINFKTQIQTSVDLALDYLNAGELVAIPTETVYGLGGDALNESALLKIFQAKERPLMDPLILHIAFFEQIKELTDWTSLSSTAQKTVEKLAKEFWPGPLTLVLPKSKKISDLATSGLETVGIRIPNHPLTLSLLKKIQKPIAAPSANRFGRISPTTAEAVLSELNQRIPLILDGGPCAVGVESTVLLVSNDGELTLLRPGGLSKERIEKCLGIFVSTHSSPNNLDKLPSPGLLLNHYAPKKRLLLAPKPFALMNTSDWLHFLAEEKLKKIGILYFENKIKINSFQVFKIAQELELTNNASYEVAAQNLFSSLRTLDDNHDVELILAEPSPTNTGLGYAINDRLTKASTNKPRLFVS
jgi:L-threonylcarbamoyladenylate synthase